MFQWTNRTIINSALDSNGSLAKYFGDTTSFTVTRCNKYLASKVLDGKVYKRAYSAGVKEVASVQVKAGTAGDVIRFTLNIFQEGANTAEYANNTSYKQHPLTVEVLHTGTAGTTADAIVAAIQLVGNRFDNTYVTAAKINTDYVQITAVDTTQRFKNLVIEKATIDLNNSIYMDRYELLSTGSVTTAGANAFGDTAYMTYNFMLPTFENTRFTALNQEEKPIPGGQYTQYSFQYKVKLNMGGSVYGEENYSITNHVFYVISTSTSAFESAITGSGTIIETISGATAFNVTISDNTLSILSGDTAKLAYVGAKGVVTYTATTNAGTVTLTGNTVTPTGAGAVTITATDTYTGGTQTDTVTLTVVA